jgi:hypothetical protein
VVFCDPNGVVRKKEETKARSRRDIHALARVGALAAWLPGMMREHVTDAITCQWTVYR